MEYFKFLPEEVTLDILSRAPAESILECKLVCKTWNHLVSHHPLFYKIYLHHLSTAEDSGKLGFIALTKLTFENENFQYFEHDQNHESTTPIQRITRINSLIRLGDSTLLVRLVWYSSVCICNPIKKEYVILPEMEKSQCDTKYYSQVSGFGYVSSTNDYKFVRICNLDTGFVESHIYTLGSGNGWRNLGKFQHEFTPSYGEPGSFANGVLYWMSRDLEMIVNFNLVEERFCENLSSPMPPGSSYGFNRIGILGGVLFFAVGLIVEGAKWFDIWLLRKKNDNLDMKEGEEHQSLGWTNEFRLDKSELLAATKSGVVLTYIDNYLNTYDPKGSTSTRLVDFKEKIRRVFPHKNTLVLLKELGEENTKIMESVEIEETESHDQPLNLL